MQGFKNILILLGVEQHSRKALLDRVVHLAKKNQAKLTVLEVVETPLVTDEMSRDFRDAAHRYSLDRKAKLDRLVASARREGVYAETKILFGKVFLEVIREVLRNSHDLVALSAEGKSRNFWFGTTVTHLLRKCPCAVWVTKPKPKPHYNRILAAVDVDPDNPVAQRLSVKVLQLAASLYRIEEASKLYIVHAWQAPVENVLVGRAGISMREVKPYVRLVRESRRRLLEQVLNNADLTGISYEVHFAKGDASRVIIGVTLRREIDNIVMGTVGREGIAGFFIGNTAERVLQHAHCSVLAIKPEGFVTPVTLG